MGSRHGISTMAAMASRNTKAANKAKSAMKAFRASVMKILQDVDSETATDASVHSLQGAIQRVKTEASGVLTALHKYSEEVAAMEESTELYDALLKEFKEYMDKVEVVQKQIPQSTISSHISQETDYIASEERIGGPDSQDVMQEVHQPRIGHPLESRILEERSQDIQSLRQSVYGIQDIYVQIGDMVEYQGDQLDDIENSMAHAFGDTLETNIHLRESAANPRGSWMRWISICIVIACLLIILLIYPKL
ncbi:hypothetical protein X943_002063 [Babesia divergens]|uniref:t-SNARE coiled-coil homology domain-containing protein n=1 Tax=Babesia divergens TaxID=32595 RepID=A0AAD9GJJ3_BABDI|nr:hypothetical protein X943_002063 [Babesia divergens]